MKMKTGAVTVCSTMLLLLILGPFSKIVGCTGIFFGDKKTALVGNNEDWMSPFCRIWFVPAEAGKFGRICFGFQEGGTQGAINDQGLFFDGFALIPVAVSPRAGQETYAGDLARKAMEECRTVEEVIALFERYDRSWLAASQLFVADRYGNSAIIEATAVVRKQGNFQIATNFRQSEVSGNAITDSRYLIAHRLLAGTNPPGVDLFRRVLAATHQEGKYPTQYSYIGDLRAGVVFIYPFHDYGQAVRLDLRAELRQGRRVIDLSSLFPESHAAKVYRQGIEKAMTERLAKYTFVPLDPRQAVRLVGEYRFGDGMLAGYSVVVRVRENKLLAGIDSLLEPGELRPLSESDYVLGGLEEVYSFRFCGDEAVGGRKLKVSMMGIEAEASRVAGSEPK